MGVVRLSCRESHKCLSQPHTHTRTHTFLSQAYYILDEVIIGGYLQEVNKREILRICATQDDMMEEPKEGPAGAAGGIAPR